MTTIEQYCNTLDQKSLFIVCNDCNILMNELSSCNCMYVNAFASIVSPDNGFDVAWFKQFIVDQGIRHFILVSHYDCKILKFLMTDLSENPEWLERKNEILELAEEFGYFKSEGERSMHRLFDHYMALQLQKVREYSRKNHLESDYKIYISAIAVDERNLTVNEIREMSVLPINESLN